MVHFWIIAVVVMPRQPGFTSRKETRFRFAAADFKILICPEGLTMALQWKTTLTAYQYQMLLCTETLQAARFCLPVVLVIALNIPDGAHLQAE